MRPWRSRLALALLAALCLLSWPAGAQTPQQAREELRSRLVALLDQWEDAAQAIAGQEEALKSLEASYAQEQSEARELQQVQMEMEERLPGVLAEESHLRARLERQERLYLQQIRALYLLGVESDQGLMASEEDYRRVAARSRAITWLLAGQHQRLNDLQAARRRLTHVQGNLALKYNQLAELRAQVESARQRLRGLHAQRSALLEGMQAKRLSLIERIAAIKEAEARLARAFALPPENGFPARPLPGVRAAQGHLSPPVQGRLLGPPGSQQQPGVTMQAKRGAPVRAPWGGRVAYAGELGWMGRVVVLDHGEKVHTVLGHLGSLAVSQGQVVAPGEVVGTVAQKGRLYLEVRLEAKAVDPRAWLRLTP
ncbi:MAG: peptidoglycan DD-metalloendopeptidase family protein [Desulfarculaceae bacterium]|nr:peptidoglycan DD-metalloendopeptidase family protein [Desulfarculaceae bacterium]MCF8073513.1 peptidoglycan DD-metalloendopeptidase family protein [Desulfarculaceae bacterium]MCF8100340.1 peptidoglycan DD-metalloendopeptidase family protein [Desulfarculaceae bacterium]MCF8117545.1 peptidoglycan DD-metalloendopeptidase family protein [Desulfarculaceae bacterium]